MTLSRHNALATPFRRAAISLVAVLLLANSALAPASDNASNSNSNASQRKATGKTLKELKLTPDTNPVALTIYYQAVKTKIENMGTCHFPTKDGKKLYGSLWMSFLISQDGAISQELGGPKITHSSGNADLDKAAIDILYRAAPFAPFPKSLLTPQNDTAFEISSEFNFTSIDDDISAIDCQKIDAGEDNRK